MSEANKVVIKRKKGYLSVEYAKPYNIDDLLSFSKEALEISKAEGYKKLFLDISKMPGRIKPMERYEVGVKAATLFRYKLKVAVLYKTEEINRFAETVALNRGMNVKIFNTKEEAISWLEVEE